jgi:potassium/hydrogen antiporter
LVEIVVPEGTVAAGKPIVEISLPPGALIVLIGRDNDFLIPSGGTRLEVGDTFLVLAERSELIAAQVLLDVSAPSAPDTG